MHAPRVSVLESKYDSPRKSFDEENAVAHRTFGGRPKPRSDRFTWIVEKFEPYYILDGKLKGQGAADRLVVLLQKELADMQHETTFMPILRIRESLKNKDHAICVSFLKDKSLAEHVQSTVATMLVPALELTLRREDWEGKWKKASSISLADFMASGAVVGIADGRRYEKSNPCWRIASVSPRAPTPAQATTTQGWLK